MPPVQSSSFDGTTTLPSVAVSAGTATLFNVSLTGGTHFLAAVYSGDTNHAMSTSATLLQVVSPSRAMSTMTLISDGLPNTIRRPDRLRFDAE